MWRSRSTINVLSNFKNLFGLLLLQLRLKFETYLKVMIGLWKIGLLTDCLRLTTLSV